MDFATVPKVLSYVAENHTYPLLFATVSGAHLYGFPSTDSDYDLRGVHILPAQSLFALEHGDETFEAMRMEQDLELDLVTHDIKKFFLLLLKRNGYVLEQLFSPLIVYTTPEHSELKEIATGCITSMHSHHYLGFSETQWRLFSKEETPRIKPLLYVYRVLLTGIYLMRTGVIEANLAILNEEFKLPYVDDLIAQKKCAEHQTSAQLDLNFNEGEYHRLRSLLAEESSRSSLPEQPSSKAALNDLLVRCRFKYGCIGEG
jgi:predicted nucleotidyltransferase